MAAEQIPGGYQSIALVDLSYMFKKNWMGTPRDAAPGTAAQQTLDELAGVRESAEHVIICCDAPPYNRKQIDPEYKAQRERPEDAELSQKKWLMDRIEKAGYPIAKAKGFEADDVIATLCKTYWWCPDVRIIGSDKDCAQCVTDTVRMFVPAVGQRPAEIRGPEEIKAKYGVPPKDMGLWLALVGDKGDNIKGIPGVGPKKATLVIEQCGSLAGIKEALATTEEGEEPNALWKAIGTNFDQLERALELTRLSLDVPVNPSDLLEKPKAQSIVREDSSMKNGSAEKVTDAEWDPISKAPAGYTAPVKAPEPEAPKPTALARYGQVSTELQPMDLQSARQLSVWFHDGALYPKFATPEAILTIIVRGKELGVSATTALASFHIVEGKPSASADLLRSLAERDPKCEYFRLVSSSTTEATWETKHRAHPAPTPYTYTIEEAVAAGLTLPSKRTGEPSNWVKRPRDMLTKTAGSKLARLVYPGATLGLYCPEEEEG